ncbi:MAG TPA: sigma 54-interacting transcriptional regulator [Desulfobaccales bacterium]|nr:sigma 54-interacting transcriptional regulator [Desulfobaccales bacterium]
MDADCGVLVVSRRGKLLAANPLAESFLARPLPSGSYLKSNGPLARSFSRHGHPIWERLSCGEEEHGLLQVDDLTGTGIFYRCIPLYSEENKVTGTVITLEKRGDEALGQALKFLGLSHEEIMDQFPEGVFLVNTRWQVSYFNRTAQEITGYSREEALGKFCWDIFRSDLCHKKCPMRITMSTGQALLDQEVEIRTKTGQKKLILVSTAQIKKPGNRVLGGVETFSDLECLQHPPEGQDCQAFADIVGVCPQMQEIIQSLPTIAASDSNVLILGESGTGKELIARAVHSLSPRSKGPFQAVNCSAIPETLLESELFGYERGAFTGAVSSKAGKFELAKGGTLFLDEIGDLRPDLQVKLLRVLEGRGFERVGGNRKIPLEARIVAATNVDLQEAMRKGKFRDDLYYRLFTVPIHLPPLREKRQDIPILVKYFLEQLNRKFNKRIRGVDPKVMKLFCRHPWPGNVREMQHVLEYCFVFAKGPFITERHLPRLESAWAGRELESLDSPFSPLQALERETILKALERVDGSKNEAARLLQISRSKLWRKMRSYEINTAEFKK